MCGLPVISAMPEKTPRAEASDSGGSVGAAVWLDFWEGTSLPQPARKHCQCRVNKAITLHQEDGSCVSKTTGYRKPTQQTQLCCQTLLLQNLPFNSEDPWNSTFNTAVRNIELLKTTARRKFIFTLSSNHNSQMTSNKKNILLLVWKSS